MTSPLHRTNEGSAFLHFFQKVCLAAFLLVAGCTSVETTRATLVAASGPVRSVYVEVAVLGEDEAYASALGGWLESLLRSSNVTTWSHVQARLSLEGANERAAKMAAVQPEHVLYVERDGGGAVLDETAPLHVTLRKPGQDMPLWSDVISVRRQGVEGEHRRRGAS